MNRAERRKRAKLGLPVVNEPVINVKKSDITRMRQEDTEKAIDTAMVLLLSIPIKVMHDKYGWGMRKRLPELSDALIDEYQAFVEGDMTLEEYRLRFCAETMPGVPVTAQEYRCFPYFSCGEVCTCKGVRREARAN